MTHQISNWTATAAHKIEDKWGKKVAQSWKSREEDTNNILRSNGQSVLLVLLTNNKRDTKCLLSNHPVN